ncbi:hypothetical protein NGB36_17220 [Streptomyces sp. RB6PN25]|uniref:Uncharacterized protein n=1 Tax=Streptomyces humicola TaxID=2953240 RepID=A0ABT1PXD2_9ACTN|nr:hypothetical protein [Streptomyces humicola]MCQ4082299.1 hypothetical protein [Streptomyces humicola]
MNLPFSLQNRPRQARLTAALGALITVGLLTWLAFSVLTGPQTPRIVANNVSRNFRTCLINDQHDAAMTPSVWSAVQEAAQGAAINAQHIVVPDTGNAAPLPYVNSLMQRHCGLIISVGPDLHDAIVTAAQHNPRQQFVSIGQPIKLPNMHSFSSASQSTISSMVRGAAHPQSPHRA